MFLSEGAQKVLTVTNASHFAQEYQSICHLTHSYLAKENIAL